MQLCSVSTVNNAWSELDDNNSNTSTGSYNTACLVFYQVCMTSLDSDEMSDRTSVKMTRPDQIRPHQSHLSVHRDSVKAD